MTTDDRDRAGRLRAFCLISAITALGLVLLALAWWWVPLLAYGDIGDLTIRTKAISDTRNGLLAGLVGVGALVTVWLNGRAYRVAAKTFYLSEQGHITDRYSRAIEQLASEVIEVRLGGVYSLERIAVDSARDHAVVVEVLSAYVRHRTGADHRFSLHALNGATPVEEKTAGDARESPTVDVQAVLSVLGRLPARDGVGRGDLRRAYLRGADLRGLNLAGIRLAGAELSFADLRDVALSAADLRTATLYGSDLESAQLQGARLWFADLRGARLRSADLRGADLEAAQLQGAQMNDANLERAVLTDALLHRASLKGARLHHAAVSAALGLDVTETS